MRVRACVYVSVRACVLACNLKNDSCACVCVRVRACSRVISRATGARTSMRLRVRTFSRVISIATGERACECVSACVCVRSPASMPFENGESVCACL